MILAEPEVVIEPVHMFDYRHKPLNRIPVPQRSKWLSEAVKFIREFDPLASRGSMNFDRAPVDRYPSNSRDIRRDDDHYGPINRSYDERERRFTTEFENRNRIDRRSFSRENDRFERDIKDSQDVFSRRERRPFNKEDDRNRRRFDDNRYSGKRYNEDNFKGDSKQIVNKDFEEFSDEEMNFESSELKKHQQECEDRGRSLSPILSNPPNPANFSEIAMIEDIINPPGRFHRPPRIVIILRGPPGSGKTYLAKLIKDKEVLNMILKGGSYNDCFNFRLKTEDLRQGSCH